MKTACEKCGKCENAISMIVTEAVVKINLPVRNAVSVEMR